MKKIVLTLLLLFAVFSIGNIIDTKAEFSDETILNQMVEQNKMMGEKIVQLEKQIYLKELIGYIEANAEIIIPEHFDSEYVVYVYDISTQHNIPIRTAFRLIYKESRFNETALSPVGASGFMQLMPETREMYHKLLNVDTLGLERNKEDIYIGLNLLNDLHNFWVSRGNGNEYSWKLALASYNAGKGSVLKYKGVPPFKETQDFVNFIYKVHSNPEFLANYSKKYENTIKNNS